MPAKGTPPDLTSGWWPAFLDCIASGKTTADALDLPGTPVWSTVQAILRENSNLETEYVRAKEVCAEVLVRDAENAIKTAENKHDLAKARALATHWQWRAGCLMPRVYGNRVSVDAEITDKRENLTPDERRRKLLDMLPKLRQELAEIGLEIVPAGQIVDADPITAALAGDLRGA